MNYKRNTGGFLIATCLSSCQLILWASRGFKATVLCRICHFDKLCQAGALGLDFLWICRLPAIHAWTTGALDQLSRWDLKSELVFFFSWDSSWSMQQVLTRTGDPRSPRSTTSVSVLLSRATLTANNQAQSCCVAHQTFWYCYNQWEKMNWE